MLLQQHYQISDPREIPNFFRLDFLPLESFSWKKVQLDFLPVESEILPDWTFYDEIYIYHRHLEYPLMRNYSLCISTVITYVGDAVSISILK